MAEIDHLFFSSYQNQTSEGQHPPEWQMPGGQYPSECQPHVRGAIPLHLNGTGMSEIFFRGNPASAILRLENRYAGISNVRGSV